MNEGYLTEEKLGKVLQEIYPNCEIVPQFEFNGRICDYAVKIERVDSVILPPSIAGILDALESEEEDAGDSSDSLTLLVEFDGNRHYMSNSRVASEYVGVEWHELDVNIFQIRIPYYIQLDRIMTKTIFGIDKDFSNGFPHGFISKHVVLPDVFCRAGEDRMFQELCLLPKEVARQVVDSLMAKTGYPDSFSSDKMSKTGSLELWERMISQFHPDYNLLLRKMRRASSDCSKYYKHFNPFLYLMVETNPILRTLYFEGYSSALTEEGADESIFHYCEWHGLSRELFDFKVSHYKMKRPPAKPEALDLSLQTG